MSNIYQTREANGESLFDYPKEDQYHKFNKEYIKSLCEGYISKIDSLVEKINLDENLDNKIKNKVLALMISLVLDNSDIAELRKNKSSIKEITNLIPNLTEIQYINDIPFDLDVVEAVYAYVIRLLQGSNILEGHQFGLFTYDNSKDYNEVFSTKIYGALSNKDLVQNIDAFNTKNRLIRKRLIEFVTKGKKIDKKAELKIRREYKFEPSIQTFVKRDKLISKKVFDLLAEKLASAYENLFAAN
jgi:hypothetical protein